VATTRSPDPVREAAAYQQQLLSLLGGDDPAEVQAATESAVADLLWQAGVDVRRRPAATEWSVLELLGHLVDAEVVGSARYRWILSEERPQLIGYDQDRWVQRLRHNDENPGEMLAFFSAMRAANIRLWQRTSEADRDRIGMHAERGPESFRLLFRMLAGHDRFHLNQMRQTLAEIPD
jgi:hypothetical protein